MKKSRLLGTACAFLIFNIYFGSVYGATFQVDFKASGFSLGAPTDPVIGTIVYEATSITAPIDSFTSISMTIDGHSYTIAEIASGINGDHQIIGGSVGGVFSGAAFADDFVLDWNMTTLTPFVFIYVVPTIDDTWGTLQFDSISVTAASVPIPAAFYLFGSGLLGLIGITRCKKTT